MGYITTAELAQFGGVSSSFLSKFTNQQQLDAIESASAIADDAIRTRYSTPLATPSGGMKVRIAHLAVWQLISTKGAPPEGLDQPVMLNYQAALTWLDQVSKGLVVPAIVDATPGTLEGAPAVVITGGVRGW